MWLKTAADNHRDVTSFCRDSGVLGMGWGYSRWHDENDAPLADPSSWDNYRAWAEGKWSVREIANVRRFRDADGLVWTRTPDGVYYLAEFNGAWRQCSGEPYDRLDLNNIRPARVEEIGDESKVPGTVVRRFSRQGHAFCQVHDEYAARYSALLWSRATGDAYPWQPTIREILDTLLSPLDVQDLVTAYLQAERGWLLFPSRLSDSTAHYEYILRDPGTGDCYAVQVKTGDAKLHLADLVQTSALKGWVVFSPNRDAYRGEASADVERLESGDLLRLMQDRPTALPPIVEAWMVQAGTS